MNVLLLAGHMNAGGITTYILTLSRGLHASGCGVVVVSSGGALVKQLEEEGIRHVALPVRVKCEVSPFLLAQAPALVNLVRRERIDVIHANTRATQMAGACVSRLTGIPMVTTCHGFFKAHWGRKVLPLWGEKVIAISRAVADHLETDHRMPPSGVALVPNGVDIKHFMPVDEAARSQARRQLGVGPWPVIGAIARLSDVKGLEFLIEAMPMVLKTLPSARCLIFGEGPMEADLKLRTKALGLDANVLFLPVVNKSASALAAFDVCAVPSLSEGLGLTVMEAQAAGVPVVASAVGGILDLIKDGETGWLVPAKDTGALAAALIKALENTELRREVAARARARIVAAFSAERMVEATLKVYGGVCKRS
jgi:glycosyltransferase involved in cell wall biosynthesis